MCLLETKEEILNSLRNVLSIMKKGGLLIIDERNFRYIIEARENILKDPVHNFRYKGNIIYCGEKVKGVPTQIPENISESPKKDGRIIFSYFEVPKDVDSENEWRIIEENKYLQGKLRMYPFKKNFLSNLLKEAGFKNIKTYSDFEDKYDETADFFTYVCETEFLE